MIISYSFAQKIPSLISLAQDMGESPLAKDDYLAG
jgi:hypothetical protein